MRLPTGAAVAAKAAAIGLMGAQIATPSRAMIGKRTIQP
jgi:hypothetical protein